MPLLLSAAVGAMSAVAVSGAMALAYWPEPAERAEERAFEREVEAIQAAAPQRQAVRPQTDVEEDTSTMGEPMLEVVPTPAPVGLESERIGVDEYIVSRSFLERLSQAREPEGRAVPFEQSGVAFGMRIYGLRRRGELEQLGFRNGDVLLRLNGISLQPSALSEVVTAIQSSTVFAVDVLRAGRVRTLRYTVLG